MSELAHGTRAKYRRGCRCLPCRSANAAYEAHYRDRRRHGRPLLGSRVSAVEAHRLIYLIRLERYARMTLEQALGIGERNLPRLTREAMISLRTLLKVRRFYRQHVLGDEPRHGSDSGLSRDAS